MPSQGGLGSTRKGAGETVSIENMDIASAASAQGAQGVEWSWMLAQ